MGDHRSPKRDMSGELENVAQLGPGAGGQKMDGLSGRGSSDVWHHGGLEFHRTPDSGVWCDTVCERGCRFMAAWVREEENASENRQMKRETEEAEEVEGAHLG